MTEFFLCRFCGQNYYDLPSMLINPCNKHPLGMRKGCHEAFRGRISNQYSCRFCGAKYSNIADLTANYCVRHPNGMNSGCHEVLEMA